MSIFFGGSPPINMKRTETSRTCFCLLEDIRNRGRFFLVLGALAVVRASEGLNSVRKGIEEGRACIAPLSHRFRCAFGMVGLTVRFVRAGIPPMSDRQVHTHSMYTNTNILYNIYVCL